ncbi:MAG: hypothetical protein ACRC2K_05945 [Clostridium sp.]
MRESIEMNKKIFYLIVALCAAIIMANSLESFIRAKDMSLFEAWLENQSLNVDRSQSMNELYSIYLTMCTSLFFIKIITPAALAINSYISFVKTRVNKIFVLIWGVLLVGMFLFTSLGQPFFSIFFIVSVICHVILFGVLIHLNREINNQRIMNLRKRTQQA